MSYANTILSKTSTEKEFISAFITSITSVTNRITRTSTTATCEDIYDAGSGTPTFTLRIDNNFELIFTRYGALGNTADRFSITVNNLLRGSQEISNLGLIFAQAGKIATSIDARAWKFIIAANDKAVTLMLGNYNTDFSSDGARFASIVDTVRATAFVIAYSLSEARFYFSDGTSGSIRHRLSYIYDGSDMSKVEIIKNKSVILSGVTPATRANTISGIYDCSRIPVTYTLVTIGNTNYFAVDSNTIMPI